MRENYKKSVATNFLENIILEVPTPKDYTNKEKAFIKYFSVAKRVAKRA